MDRQSDGQTVGWRDSRNYRQLDGQTDRWTARCPDGQMDRRMNSQRVRERRLQLYISIEYKYPSKCYSMIQNIL
jgi:hypothetical protein